MFYFEDEAGRRNALVDAQRGAADRAEHRQTDGDTAQAALTVLQLMLFALACEMLGEIVVARKRSVL